MGNTADFSNKKVFLLLPYFLLLLCMLPIGIFSFRHPTNNWDMLGYMAVVLRMDGIKDINEVHRITYKSAKEHIPVRDFNKLVDTSGPRAKFAGDPIYFEKVLPVYVVKPLYTWLVYLFYKAGFTLPAATVLPSVIAYFLIGLLLLYWLNKYLKKRISLLLVLLIMAFVFMLAASRLSTPDTLSAFFLLLAFYFILENPNIWLVVLCLLPAIFSRVDNVITGFFIVSFLSFSPKWEKRVATKQYLLILLILSGAYLITILPVRQFGWSLFYYSEYARHMNFNQDFDKALTFADYFSFMFSKAISGLVSSHLAFFIFLTTLLFLPASSPKIRHISFHQLFALLLIGIMLIRFILLPDLSDRFYTAFYLVITILLVKTIIKSGEASFSSLE